jgi:nitrite reductase/ring-hydroxylating ferredoxin subunit
MAITHVLQCRSRTVKTEVRIGKLTAPHKLDVSRTKGSSFASSTAAKQKPTLGNQSRDRRLAMPTPTRAPFLKTRYSGYHHRHVPQEDTELTHVGPDTPCGEYLRRFWQPICYSDELKDLPLAVKILGEELVVFRDGSGAIGLLERHCPHRGTSLEFGLVGAKGIRCCYHGWLFDVDGAILETPGVPRRVPCARGARPRLRLHWTARSDAGISHL